MTVFRCSCGWAVEGEVGPWIRLAVDHWAAGHRVRANPVFWLPVKAAALGLALSGYEPRNL